MDLTTYLTFNGDCEAAFRFYEPILGGKILMMFRYADAPMGEPVAPEARNRIMHTRMQVGDRLLMASDAPLGRDSKAQGFCVSIGVDTPAEAERIYNALVEGGTATMPIGETFWAHRFGMLVDRFGTPWMVNCEKPMGANQSQSQSDDKLAGSKPFVISRTFDAPRDKIWKALTDPKLMQKWWGPKGVTVFQARMDLRPGGTFHYGMRTPEGSEMWGKMVYREIAPPVRLEFVNSFSDPDGGLTRHPLAPKWPLGLLSTFQLKEAAGKTTFTVTWTPLSPTAEERAAFDAGHESMKQGWTGTLDRLEDYLAKA